MKNLKYINYLAAAFTLLAVSCVDFDKLNENPTQSPNMDPNLQIPTIELLQSNQTDNWHRFLIYPGGFMNQWTQDWATIEYGGKGQKSDAYFSLYWDMYYSGIGGTPGIIKEVVDLTERTRDIPEYTNIHAMARILKVENFLRLTDIYGDIPYFDAAKAYYSGIFRPKYDTQEMIFDDFFKELKEAAASLSANYPKATADLYYSGDVDLWRKFANSLRLRIAMRLIKVDPARAKVEVQSAVNDGVFTSNSDICYLKHENVKESVGASAGNGLANILLKDKSSTFRLTRELIGTMEDLGDPRLLYYGSSYLEDNVRTEITPQLYAYYGTYKELVNPAQIFNYDMVTGAKSAITINVNGVETEVPWLLQLMQPSKVITNYGSPYIHLSYAEVEFLQAEAVVKGFIAGNAQDHFKKGMEAAVNQWSLFDVKVPADAAANYSAKNPLQSGKELEQIGTQLWILNVLDPVETWSNWRRMEQPNIQFYNNYPTVNQSNGKTPRRIPYPVSEQKNNYDEWKTAVDRLGGTDDWLSRMWWDK
ncbi:MAG: SusD/RagB family nutrient-binding outer membrane lipoprotein [Dysgonamonadaceae bacterium]|jgi:hypothetical protein|nr:SusD/RagB family nutrient-binding outer membrane lipoprotein [Dysgonamonadaceae bacterium]